MNSSDTELRKRDHDGLICIGAEHIPILRR